MVKTESKAFLPTTQGKMHTQEAAVSVRQPLKDESGPLGGSFSSIKR